MEIMCFLNLLKVILKFIFKHPCTKINEHTALRLLISPIHNKNECDSDKTYLPSSTRKCSSKPSILERIQVKNVRSDSDPS